MLICELFTGQYEAATTTTTDGSNMYALPFLWDNIFDRVYPANAVQLGSLIEVVVKTGLFIVTANLTAWKDTPFYRAERTMGILPVCENQLKLISGLVSNRYPPFFF